MDSADKGAFISSIAHHAADPFRLLVEAVVDYAILMLDPAGRIISWNPGAERIYGYTAEAIVNQPFSRLYVMDQYAVGQLDRELQDVKRYGRHEVECLRTRADGSRFWAISTTTDLKDYFGTHVGFANVTRDITERKRAEESNRELMHLLAERVKELTCLHQACLVFQNDQYGPVEWLREIGQLVPPAWQYPESTVVRVRLGEHEYASPRFAETPWAQRAEFVDAGGNRGSIEVVYLTDKPASVEGPFMAEERILLDALTNLLRTAADRRALEAQLRQSQKMEAIGHLAGGIAHDFNNLLTVINGYSELLLGQFGPDDAARESVVAIYKAGERAVWLTRQLLAFSRRDVVRPRRIDLNAVLDDLHLLLRRLIGEHIVLTVSLGPGTGLVEIDPGQVQQVLMNLAANARDAMPHGGQLTIETRTTRLTDLDVRTRPALRPGEYVTLTVCDTGTGMDEATLARVFEPFFTTKAEGKGTGLGLAVVHGIVSQNRGHCEVVSKVGVGTKFVIYLPRIDEPQPPEPAAGLCSSMPPGRETILLVEDEDAVRALARHILLSCGYTVLESSDGAEAVRLADTHDGPIHLLASDVVMPHMGGRDLAARMAARNPGLKVLFLSGYANDPAFRKAVSTTAVDFLQKPFAPQELAQRVRRLLDEVVSGA